MLSNIGLPLAGCDHFLETLFCVGQLVFQILDLRMRVEVVFGWLVTCEQMLRQA